MNWLIWVLIGFLTLSTLVGLGLLCWAWWGLQKEIEAGCPSSDEVFDPETEMTDAQ